MKKILKQWMVLGTIASLSCPAQTLNTSTVYTPSIASVISEEKINLSPKELIDIKLDEMTYDPVLKNASWSFVLYDPKSKKIISSYNETAPLIPASTTKLLTTDAVLNLLGSNFRWTTQMEYSGEIDEEGVLNGNLYIVGSGDPSIGTGKAGSSRYPEIVNQFVMALHEKGIKKINGNIIAQTAFFKDNKMPFLPENIVWQETAQYYLPAGGTRDVNPANERLIARKKTPFRENDARSYYYVSPYINKMVFAEKFEGTPMNTKIADAPLYLAGKIKEVLPKNKIIFFGKVEAKINDPLPEMRTKITDYKSPTLAEIVYDTNQRSDNALSESLLRTLGFMTHGDYTLAAGKNAMNSHLKSIDFDSTDFVYMDGSGLSRAHRVTSLAQAKFLASRMNTKYYPTFFDSLPIAGQTGTLKRSFKGPGYGQIYAKTGTLNRVKTLAGYVKTNSGKTLVFSLLLNNYSGSVDQAKNRMEKILEPVLDF
ncbi:D-alanyl-D-alanine carboxypeptidase/D-alanyl-D-alanine endopeptidase [Bergeyella zoohelcum]|uniref:D-alanyl-D-alanine carboxypeptidase/D-alanyl-D-alanine-endopeptidase n=1 Tax=Bergeyella zoohelcum ATCC 43767 TaxID=883096 RepID=K1LXW2_9FLAO|nr:D-alanyl-D-alanine carboxypeptidase/D-alanyl-D-alanine-endopeptidase [Bergeyella zoohelcum]EKB56917.1 D-alanyl-D-alanine carboxypeptidase/D-alanyl-D-alanine-endopeptidase [Bergeyella zoohelcum ATCC 43767]SUV48619.1 D-alanyl-D-alanine carboxypeptidase dacC precursor [Bergeyella zoohelcum]